MSTTQQIASHIATVSSVGPGMVAVVFSVEAGCRTCQAASHCGMVESTRRRMEVPTDDWQQYAVGDQVELSVSAYGGMRAVAVAYVAPALLLVSVCAVVNSLAGEMLAIAASLAAVGLYWLALRLFKSKTNKKYSFAIRHLHDGAL